MAEPVDARYKTELHRNPAALARNRGQARPRRPRDRHLRMGRTVQRRTDPHDELDDLTPAEVKTAYNRDLDQADAA